MKVYGKDEPIPDWSTVDEGKLDSALHAPRYAFDGRDAYPSLEEKSAVLLYGIAKAHALSNGNKRMAMVSTFLFLGLNAHWWAAESEEVRAHVTWLAASEARARDEVIAYMTKYFQTGRIVPLRNVIGSDAVAVETILPH